MNYSYFRPGGINFNYDNTNVIETLKQFLRFLNERQKMEFSPNLNKPSYSNETTLEGHTEKFKQNCNNIENPKSSSNKAKNKIYKYKCLPLEVRKEILNQIKYKPVKDVANSYNLPVRTIYRWLKKELKTKEAEGSH